jgi:hypothetical protein
MSPGLVVVILTLVAAMIVTVTILVLAATVAGVIITVTILVIRWRNRLRRTLPGQRRISWRWAGRA